MRQMRQDSTSDAKNTLQRKTKKTNNPRGATYADRRRAAAHAPPSTKPHKTRNHTTPHHTTRHTYDTIHTNPALIWPRRGVQTTVTGWYIPNTDRPTAAHLAHFHGDVVVLGRRADAHARQRGILLRERGRKEKKRNAGRRSLRQTSTHTKGGKEGSVQEVIKCHLCICMPRSTAESRYSTVFVLVHRTTWDQDGKIVGHGGMDCIGYWGLRRPGRMGRDWGGGV